MTRFAKPKRAVKEPDVIRSVNPMDELQIRWDKDDFYKRLMVLLDSSYKIDCNSVVAKIASLHTNRNIRYLEGKAYNTDDVSDIALQETSTRSKIVGTVADLKLLLVKFEALRKVIKTSAASYDYSWLSDNVKTQTDRTHFIESLFADVDIRMADMQAVVDYGETVIADIDKAGYTTSALMKGFELSNKTERTFQGR